MVILDEAHLFFGTEDKQRSHSNAISQNVRDKFLENIRDSQKDHLNGCKVLIATATPIASHPYDLFAMLKLCVPAYIPVLPNYYSRENEAVKLRVNPRIALFPRNRKECEDLLLSDPQDRLRRCMQGIVSYYDSTNDPTIFAPVRRITRIHVPVTYHQLAIIDSQCLARGTQLKPNPAYVNDYDKLRINGRTFVLKRGVSNEQLGRMFKLSSSNQRIFNKLKKKEEEVEEEENNGAYESLVMRARAVNALDWENKIKNPKFVTDFDSQVKCVRKHANFAFPLKFGSSEYWNDRKSTQIWNENLDAISNKMKALLDNISFIDIYDNLKHVVYTGIEPENAGYGALGIAAALIAKKWKFVYKNMPYESETDPTVGNDNRTFTILTESDIIPDFLFRLLEANDLTAFC